MGSVKCEKCGHELSARAEGGLNMDAERYRRLRRSYYQQRCMIGPDPKPSEEDFNKAYDAAEDRHYPVNNG